MKKGDFVLIEFVGKVLHTGEVFDLTSESLAKGKGIFNPEHKYEPALVIIGAKMVIPGVERVLEEMSVGEEREFAVKPQDGFGIRDPKLIKIVSLANFLKQNINPAPGIFVSIDGLQAKIQSVSGGRVRADFNHPLAGKELEYKIKIVKEITEPLEKAKALLNYYNIKAEAELNDAKLTIKPEKPLGPLESLLKEDIKQWIKGIKEVEFINLKVHKDLDEQKV